jgi:hypothetical protein
VGYIKDLMTVEHSSDGGVKVTVVDHHDPNSPAELA